MSPGEEKAWEILKGLAPEDVCKNTLASFDEKSGKYRLKSFGISFDVDPANRTISTAAPEGPIVLERLGYFSKLSIIWYMTGSRDIPFSGRLLQPVNLKGGQIFFRGSHVLPLDKLAEKFGRDPQGFIEKGLKLGGTVEKYGDASIRLEPLPRVPVVLSLWREDEEFPARVDLMFDSTCEFHLALDVLWSVAMECVLIMMQP